MGAHDLLAKLAAAGVTVIADGDRLVIRPASRLTDDHRSALRAAKTELLALLGDPTRSHTGMAADAAPDVAPVARPHRLSPEDADRAHLTEWDDTTIATFTKRVTLFLRRGINATDADDLAEALVLRDRDGDDRRLCVECSHLRRTVCNSDAGMDGYVGDMLTMLQRCPGFEEAKQ